MRHLRSLFAAIAAIAIGGVLFAPDFSPRIAVADVPIITVSGTLTNVGDQVILANLIGQSSCSMFASGVTGAVDVEGTNDTSTSPTWTKIAVFDYASPPTAQTQPFSPNIGQAYQFSPTSLRKVRVVADSTWSGGPATVQVTCSQSVARVPVPSSSGGGGSYGAVEPITLVGSNFGFDYSFAGDFSASQNIGGSYNSCGSVPTGLYLGNTSVGQYPSTIQYEDTSGAYHMIQTYNSRGCHPGHDAINVASTDANVTVAIGQSVGDLFKLPAYSAGCLYVDFSGLVNSTSDGSVCASGASPSPIAIVAGTNIVVTPTSSPAGGQIIATASFPTFTNVNFTDSGLTAAPYAGLAADGMGGYKLIATAAQPCPSTGCGVVGISGISPITVSSSPNPIIPTISLGIVPTTLGGFGANVSGYAAGTCPIATGSGSFTPEPCATGTPAPIPTFLAVSPLAVATTASTVTYSITTPTPLTFSATAPLSASQVGSNVNYALSTPLSPQYGGLGVNVTSLFSNNQCAAYNATTMQFFGTSCGGGSYVAGLNIAITGSTIATTANPTFTSVTTGNGTDSKLQTVNGFSVLTLDSQFDGSLGANLLYSNGAHTTGDCASDNCSLILAVGMQSNLAIQARNSPGLYMHDGVTGTGYACFFGQGSTSTAPNLTCKQQFNTDGTSSFSNTVTIEGTAVNPSKGVASCTVPATTGTGCSATATVLTGSTCVASYSSNSPITVGSGPWLSNAVSGSTLQINLHLNSTNVGAAETVFFNYVCM